MGTPKIVLTGHSLGGALTLIAAAEWLHAGKYEVQSMYTYGQPAVGKTAFATFVKDKMGGRYHVIDSSTTTISYRWSRPRINMLAT